MTFSLSQFVPELTKCPQPAHEKISPIGFSTQKPFQQKRCSTVALSFLGKQVIT